MARKNSRTAFLDDSDHYCGHCLTPVGARTPSCPSCDRSFAGPGRFQRLPGSPLHFSQRSVPLGPAPNLGQHNAEIVGDLLGYPDEALADLIAAGTLATEPPT